MARALLTQRQPGLRRVLQTRPRRVALHASASAMAAHAAHALADLAVAPVCFNRVCQEATDRAFLLAVCIPITVTAAAVAYNYLRPLPEDLKDRSFEDPATGAVFEAPEGVTPDRDQNGELAFRPISYTPWPVPADYEGSRVRVPVGPVADRQRRTFVFNQLLPGRSEIVTVTLPRPLGVVFEYDERFKRTMVVGTVEGSNADQRRRQAALNRSLASAAVLEGDVLRAVTATNMVYPTRALFGAVPPERHIVLYGADKQRWSSVRTALRKGEMRDGEVTLVLERRLQPGPRPSSADSSSNTSSSSSWSSPVPSSAAEAAL